ncbi:MAG: Peptidase [Fibrobacteres bacterium]|nr:Peptidase [Fibrobacterota bacterium]
MKSALGLACLLPALCAADPVTAFDAGKVAFQVRYKEETSPYRVNAVFLMPGETLSLEIPGRDPGHYGIESGTGAAVPDSGKRQHPDGARAWKWKAPDSAGLYPLKVYRDSSADTVLFNAFVMVPISEMKGEYLRGYHIGDYPRSPLKSLDFYRAPKGFIKMDVRTARAYVSPHFRLGQFVCKQTADLPAYLVLKERLILKLELVLEKANRAGYACSTFHVMSGYRTPFYNRLIGNVKHSAHQFGGAADIFIDANPEDGEMDDLNGDGKSDAEDSELLFNLVDAMSLNEFFLPYLGGIGKYSKNQSHGAFVHVDVRGFRAIW